MDLLCCSSLQALVPFSQLGGANASPIVGPVVLSRPVGLVGGPVGPGNVRSDVEAVQSLLNLAHEKTGRPKSPIAVDGKVGNQTLAAIRDFQDAQLGFHDGTIQPGKRTIARLNQIAAGAAGMGTLKASALAAVPEAMVWVLGAQAALGRLLRPSGGAPPGDADTINKHFHFDRLKANAVPHLMKVRHVFALTLEVLGNPEKFIQEGPGPGFADAPMGGFHFKNSPLFNHITVRREFPTAGPKARSAMVLHECAHFVGFVNEIRHFAMEFPEPDGRPQDGGGRNYSQLTPDEAVRNASTYAAYAIHAATGVDSRFGLGKPAV